MVSQMKWQQFAYNALNYVFFYFGWGLCLEQASEGRPYIGPFVVLLILLFHLALATQKRAEIVVIVSVTLIGSLLDTLYSLFGIIQFQATLPFFPWAAPLWVTSIWVLYSMCLNHSLQWLHQRWLLASLLGSLGAICSYLAASRIGAITFLMGETSSLILIGTVWAIAFPLSLSYSRWVGEKLKMNSLIVSPREKIDRT